MSWSTSSTPVPAAAMSRMRVAEALALSIGVETGGGLVEQQHRRVGRARPRDRHELPFTLAELARRADRAGRRSRRVRVLRSTRRWRCSWAVLNDRGADVLLDGEVVVELERLEGARRASPHPRVGGKAVDALALQRDRAVGRANR